MTRSLVRRLLAGVSRVVPLDTMLQLSQRVTGALAGLVFVRDWRLEAFGRPQFFKHRIDLSRWTAEPFRWSFTARGVYARESMFKGCRVLDLCCGDGSYSYLFFSDIAGRIDAVDNDPGAIAYARRNYAATAIDYHKLDIVREPLPPGDYDFVVWNAAICYFHETEIRQILEKIIAVSKPTLQLNGMLPRANGWVDHKTEFNDVTAVSQFLRRYFAQVTVREVDEGSVISFYFQARDPLRNERVYS